ncbi:MAG: DUF58 domain-containing protein [Caldilineaceae bacterium]|nr:DUF58 domain-containing protein [Caldilineaceae bacterium]MCB9139201.1 DUF58 domain-containing protein [Caldilineaceae bacterium]
MSSRLIFLLAGVLATWILSIATGRQLWYNMAYLLSAILALSFIWAQLSIRSLTVRRQARNRRTQVGQFAEEHMELTNRSRVPKLWIEVEDYSTLPWHDVSRVVSMLRSGRSFSWQIRTLCMQRGRYRLGPITVRSGDPLGIFEVKQHMPSSSYLLVFPSTVELPFFEPSISEMSGGETHQRRTYQVTTNAAGVRDYLPGDSLNRIHWATTARLNRLMTKEFELDPTSNIWIYLDLFAGVEVKMAWQQPSPEVGIFALDGQFRRNNLELPPNTTEYGVTAAASLARYFLLRNRAVGMSSQGRTREFLQADRGERQINKILEALAVVEARGTLPFSQLVATDGMRLNRNDTVVAISADPATEWGEALQDLQRRGVNSIAVIVDGRSFGRAVSYTPLLTALETANIATYILHRDEPISDALSDPYSEQRVGRAVSALRQEW